MRPRSSAGFRGMIKRTSFKAALTTQRPSLFAATAGCLPVRLATVTLWVGAAADCVSDHVGSEPARSNSSTTLPRRMTSTVPVDWLTTMAIASV